MEQRPPRRGPLPFLLVLLLLAAGCGNYSLLEKLGPGANDSYFHFTPGRYWVYDGIYQELHKDPITVTLTNIIAESLHFTNTAHLIFTNKRIPDSGFYGFCPTRYGYDQTVNILALLPAETWGTTASPATVTIPYLTMPFVEGRVINTVQTQVIINYPLISSSIPATVLTTYTTRNEVLKNNLTLEVNGTEYEKCVKIHHTLTVTVTSLGDNAPYSNGDTIQITEDDQTLHLAPGVGIIMLQTAKRNIGQNNIYQETLFSGGLIMRGRLP